MRYCIGSISKQCAATALVMLADEGKLSLDDRVGRFFPDLTRAGDITVRQLLSHTAGIRDYWPQDYVFTAMLEPITTRALLDRWARQPLDFEPGTRYQYSNTGYVIAGAIAEKVSGRPLMELLRQRIFTPLGMASVLDVDQGRLGPGDATGYMNYGLGPPREAPKGNRSVSPVQAPMPPRRVAAGSRVSARSPRARTAPSTHEASGSLHRPRALRSAAGRP
jgi:CubicO group peptidase (beta-lactamase class C family)